MLSIKKIPKRLAPHFAEVFWVNPIHRASLLGMRATIAQMSSKKPLEPLIPLNDLKKVVAQIAHVPKDAVEEAQTRRKTPKQEPSDQD